MKISCVAWGFRLDSGRLFNIVTAKTMEMLVLDAQTRDTSKKVNNLRKENIIPAVCYGKGFKTHNLQMEYQSFRKIYKVASTTQVVNLNLNGEKLPVLIHQIDYNPVSDRFDHVDFLQIDMKKMVTASVPVEVVGVSPAVKNFNAVVTIVKQEIEVRCLPMDIPHEISIDISKLENLGDAIHVSDLKLGDKVEIIDEPETTLVSVNAVEEFVEQAVEVPDELKVDAAASGAEGAAAEGEKADAKEEKKEE